MCFINVKNILKKSFKFIRNNSIGANENKSSVMFLIRYFIEIRKLMLAVSSDVESGN